MLNNRHEKKVRRIKQEYKKDITTIEQEKVDKLCNTAYHQIT